MAHHLVLDSSPDSQYLDDAFGYEFPKQYLGLFEPLERGEPVFVLLYEPQGDSRTGRKAFVGWAWICDPPIPSARLSKRGGKLWRVQYVGGAKWFPHAVPWHVDGDPLETWLRDLPEQFRNVRRIGRSVRELSELDLQRILERGYAEEDRPELTYPFAGDLLPSTEIVAERTRRMISAVERDASFRSQVLAAYGQRCAVSGFALGGAAVSRLSVGLIDAAHIRPIGQHGPDHVSNGLALTPTLHRLFDAGLFTLRRHDRAVEVRVSPRLDDTMVAAPDGTFRLPLRDGLRLRLPSEETAWPSPEYLRFHEHEVFIRAS